MLGPRSGQRVHVRANPARLGQVVGVGGGPFRLQPHGALPAAAPGGFVKRHSDGLRVVATLVAQQRQVRLCARIETRLNGTCHDATVLQITVRCARPARRPALGVVLGSRDVLGAWSGHGDEEDTIDDALTSGHAALERGAWPEASERFRAALEGEESGEAWEGLG